MSARMTGHRGTHAYAKRSQMREKKKISMHTVTQASGQAQVKDWFPDLQKGPGRRGDGTGELQAEHTIRLLERC